MAANYLHGVETIEIESGPRAIQIVKSAVIVLVGTAPFGPVNVLTQCLSERTAAQFGPRLAGFTMPYAFKAIFDHGAGTVLAINVCDPTRHSSAIMAESVTFGTNNLAQLSRCAIQSITIAGKQEGVDFILDYLTGEIRRLPTGTIAASANVTINYQYTDPARVSLADIIGTVDAAGHRSGLKAAENAYNDFGYFGKIFIAPGFSTLTSISTELIAAASKMWGIALIDAPIGTTPQQAITGRGPNGTINFATSSERAVLCYPI